MCAVDHRSSERLCKPIGMFSHGFLLTNAEKVLHIAGQVAVNADGVSVGVGDFETQFNQVFDNIGAVLEAGGMWFDNIVRLRTYIVDPATSADFYYVRERLFPRLFKQNEYPPNTLLTVKALVGSEFLIEVEGMAVLGGNSVAITGARR